MAGAKAKYYAKVEFHYKTEETIHSHCETSKEYNSRKVAQDEMARLTGVGMVNFTTILENANAIEPEIKEVPASVKSSQFGCRNCLWNCVECKNGSKYSPTLSGNCEAYTYYD